MDLCDGLDGIQMIDTRIKANLIHDRDASFFDLGFELLHCRAGVGSCDDVHFLSYGRLDDRSMVGVGNQTDRDLDFADFGIQSCFIFNVQ